VQGCEKRKQPSRVEGKYRKTVERKEQSKGDLMTAH